MALQLALRWSNANVKALAVNIKPNTIALIALEMIKI